MTDTVEALMEIKECFKYSTNYGKSRRINIIPEPKENNEDNSIVFLQDTF